MSIAICPGSFDPITLGHLNIVRRTSRIFERVIVLAMVNANKSRPMFTLEERVDMIKRVVTQYGNVEVATYDGLLAEYAKQFDHAVIVKGLRASTDFENEFQMAQINKMINPALETMFLTTQAQNMFLSSSMVKDIASFGGDISSFVPACILGDIQQRLCKGGNKHE